MTRRAHAVAFLVAASLIAVRFDGSAHAAPGAAADRAARDRFQKAEMSFNMGRFADALGEYQAAYEAKPLPAFLFNIAQCYRNLQNYEKARFFYRRYLALDPRTSNRRLVDDLIAEMTKMIDKSDAAKVAEAASTKAAEAAEATTMPTVETPPAPTAPPTVVQPPPVAPPPLPPAPPPPVTTVELQAPAAAATEPPPLYKRWWFWGGVGAAVIAAVTVTWLVTRDPSTPTGSLGTINGR
jgi:hypothetical protein